MTKNITSPFTGGEVREITHYVKVTFKGEEFELDVPGLECVDTGNIFNTAEITEEITARIQNLWRARHHVPTVEQLKNLRKKLGLTKKAMSSFFRLGVNQYRYYEKGEIPKGPALLLLQIAIGSDFGLQHLMAAQTALLPEKTKEAYDDFLCGKTDEIFVNSLPIVVENTPRINTNPIPYASAIDENENFQTFPTYRMSEKVTNESVVF